MPNYEILGKEACLLSRGHPLSLGTVRTGVEHKC